MFLRSVRRRFMMNPIRRARRDRIVVGLLFFEFPLYWCTTMSALLQHNLIFTSSRLMSRHVAKLCFGLLTLLLFLPAAVGQENATEQPDVDDLIDERYHRVYVPNDGISQLFSFQEGVLLGKQEFSDLLRRAAENRQTETGRPAEFLLRDVTYTLERSGDVMTIHAECQLTKQAPGWAELKLPVAEVSLISATLDDKPAPLGLSEDEKELVLLDRFTGTRALKLTLTTPMERSGTDELTRFRVFPPNAATLKMSVPAGRTIQLNGTRLEADGAQPEARDIQVPVGGMEAISIRLSDALSESLEESLVFASTDYAVAAERDSIRWQAVCHLRTFGKRFNKLEFAVPQRLEVTAVEASGLQSWEIQDDAEQPGRFRLQLSFRETLPDQIAVTLRGVQLLDESADRWRVAPLAVLGATTHTGRLALTAPRDVRMKATGMRGIRPATNRWDIPKTMAGQTEQFFEIWEENFSLEITLAELSGELHAAVSHVLDVDELDVLLSSVVTLQTQFTPVFELTAEIPAGWQPESITEGNRSLAWQFDKNEGDSRRLRIPLSPPLKPGQKRTLQFRLTLQREGGLFTTEAETFPLPTLALEGGRILEGTFAITAAESLDVVPEDITGMDPALLGLPNERFGFRYQDSVISGQVRVKRKTPHFNVSTQETVWLDEQLAHQQMLSTLDITGGGLRQVTVEVSPLPQVNVEMQSLGNVRISEQRRTKTETGMRWTLTFDRYVTGAVQLALPLLVERKENPWPVALVHFPEAELQDQYLAFLAEDDQQLSLNVAGGDEQRIDPLDPADVPLTVPAGRRFVVAGYHLTQPGASAAVGLETYAPTGVPTAIGRELTLETLLLEQSVYQQQATLRFAAVGVQSLLVSLPEGARLWSTMVDEKPLAARKTEGGFLVPLSGLAGEQGDHNLTVVYGLEEAGIEAGGFRRATLPAPKFAAVDGQGARKTLPTLHSRWQLHHAPEAHVKAISPGVHQTDQVEENSWRERFLERVGRLSLETIAFSVAIGVGLCLFAGFVVYSIRRYSARLILPGLVIMVAFAVLIPCLLPKVQRSREATRMSPSPQSGRVQSFEESTGPIGSFGEESAEELADMNATLDDDVLPRDAEFMMKKNEELARGGDEQAPEMQQRRQLERAKDWTSTEEKRPSPHGFSRTLPDSAPRPNSLQSQTRRMEVEPPLPPSGAGVGGGFGGSPNAQPMWGHARTGGEHDPLASPPEMPAQKPQASQAAPQAEPQVKKDLLAANQGLLSLPLTLQIPGRLTTTVFETYHAADDGLAIRYLSQTSVQRMRWVCLTVTVLLFWLLRNAQGKNKASLAILLLGLGTAATGVLPINLLPLVEGILAGCLTGVVIWLLLFLIRFVPQHLFDDITTLSKAPGAAALLLVAGLSTNSLLAEDVKLVEKDDKTPIVFPYDLEAGPLAADQVFIPAQEYKRLSQQANPEWNQPAAPAAYHIHEANYRAEFVPGEGEDQPATVSLRGRYVIEFYRSGEQKVPLPIGPAVVKSVQIDGKASGGLLSGNKRPAVLLSSTGVHVVDVEFELPAEVFGVAGQFDVQLQPVASGALSFRLPDPGLRVEVNDGKIAYRKIERDDATFAEIPITSGGSRNVSWQPDVEASGAEFLSAESAREVRIGDQGAELRYGFKFRIAQGTFSEVEFQLPADVQLKTLFGDDVAGWQRVDEGRLRVLLKRAVDDQTEIGLSLYAPLDINKESQQWTLPDVQPLGVTREIGTWGIAWDPALETRVENVSGVRQLPVAQFPRIGKNPLVETFERVYRFTGRPHEIGLTVYRRASEAIATHYTLINVQMHKTHMATLASVEVRGEPKLSLEFAIPADLQVINLQANDLEDWFIQPADEDDASKATLTVLFNHPQQGRIQVFLSGHVQQEALAAASLKVLGPQLTGVTRNTSYLAIGAAESLGLQLKQRDGWQTVDPTRLPSSLKEMATLPVRIGLSQSGEAIAPVELGVLEGTPQFRANSVTLIAVTDLSLDYGLALEWEISNAAASKFSFYGPNWFVDRISFESPHIRHITTTKMDDSQSRWTIETKRPLEKTFLVTAAISLPLPEDRLVQPPLINFVVAAKSRGADDLMLESQGHYAVLVNLGREPLEPLSDHQRQLIDAGELPLKIPDQMRRQAVEIVRITRSVFPKWELKELEQAELPPATIPLAELSMAIDGAGVWRTSAVYQVKNREQQFLPLVMPEGAELLSVMVGNRPARPVQRTIDGKPVQLIAMPTTGAADLAVKVQVVLEGRLEQPLLAGWGRRQVRLPAPQILDKEQSAEYGIPVMHTVWTLSTPEEMRVRTLTGDGTNVSEATPDEVERISILNSLQSMIEMSKIAKSGKYSSRQRARAQENLKVLRDEAEFYLRDDVQYYDSDSDASITLNDNINDTLADVEQVVEADLGITEGVAPVDRQALGRDFVLSSNGGILVENGSTGLSSHTILNQTRIDNGTNVDSFSLGESLSSGDGYRMPSSSTIGKQSGVVGSIQVPNERGRLLEENLRQNSVLNNDLLQKRKTSNEAGEQKLQLGWAAPNLSWEDSNRDGLAYSNSPEVSNPFGGNAAELFEGEAAGQQAGGLSLPVELPEFANQVSYSKVGGHPELEIEVYAQAWRNSLLGAVWTVAFVLITLWLLWLLPRFQMTRHARPVLVVGLLVSLVAFVVLPLGLAILCLLVGMTAAMFLGGMAATEQNEEAAARYVGANGK